MEKTWLKHVETFWTSAVNESEKRWTRNLKCRKIQAGANIILGVWRRSKHSNHSNHQNIERLKCGWVVAPKASISQNWPVIWDDFGAIYGHPKPAKRAQKVSKKMDTASRHPNRYIMKTVHPLMGVHTVDIWRWCILDPFKAIVFLLIWTLVSPSII